LCARAAMSDWICRSSAVCAAMCASIDATVYRRKLKLKASVESSL
jgi:hypothetical protein